MNLNKDTAVWRGVRTGLQAIVGFFVGLVATIWAVPGVPQAVTTYLEHNALQVALTIGIPSGIAGFVWNALRKDVPTK